MNGIHVQCLKVEQLQLVAQLGLSGSKDPDVRADVMAVLGTAGKMALRNQVSGLPILRVRCSVYKPSHSHSCVVYVLDLVYQHEIIGCFCHILLCFF